MFQHLTTVAGAIADIIVPPACLACRRHLATDNTLCATCWTATTFIRPPLCDRLGLPMPFDTGGTIISAGAIANPPDYDRARAVAHYSGTMRDLIVQMKYADRHDLRTLFGHWLAIAAAPLLSDGDDIIIPVPMHRTRLLWRRFNQAALLAGELARKTERPHEPGLLIRQRATRSQVGLTEAQRRTNLRGVFAVRPNNRPKIKGRNILLVDDVITTGTTVNACARVLKRHGAAQVNVVALAVVTPYSRLDLAS